jgi:hypothetical protein
MRKLTTAVNRHVDGNSAAPGRDRIWPLRPTGMGLLTMLAACGWGGAPLMGQTTAVSPPKYVKAGALPPGWQPPLWTYGDRLQKAGKERLVIAGTVTRGSSTAPFQAIQELPYLLQYQEGTGSSGGTVVFNGTQYGARGNSLATPNTDLVETLSYDTPVCFFYGPVSGYPARKLGSRFRSDGLKSGPYIGPSYDVYLVLVPVQQSGKIKQQPKLYHVNSNTQLIERVYYQDVNTQKAVLITLGNWTTISNNRVPQLIQRLENGVEVLRLTITSAVLGPSIADNAFQIQ